MADRKYAVTFGGELIEGMTPARLRERLSKLSEPIATAQVDALLNARNATVKLFADRESADRFVGVLREAGMVCWLRLLHPGEPVHALLDGSVAPAAEPIAMAATPAITPAARWPMLGPGAMTALLVAAIGGSIGTWYAWPEPSRHHRTAASTPDSAPVTEPVAATPTPVSTPSEPQTAPTVPARTSTALMVPEPTLVVAAKHDKAKSEPAAETAKLEAPKAEPTKALLPASSGVATFAPVQATVAPAPATPVSTQVAMTSPRVAAPTAEVIVAPSYDRSKVPQPKYPAQAYRNGDQGEVLLSVLVGADGKAKKVSVDRTSGSTLLDRAALDTVKGWQFKPGTRNGVPQEAARQVAVGFKLGDQ